MRVFHKTRHTRASLFWRAWQILFILVWFLCAVCAFFVCFVCIEQVPAVPILMSMAILSNSSSFLCTVRLLCAFGAGVRRDAGGHG